MPPMPAEAEAPPDLATPLTASPACSAARASASSSCTVGSARSIRSRSGQSCASRLGVGEAGEFVFRRGLGHGHGARGERIGIAGEVVGGDHRLALADQHAQAEIVAFRALRFLDRALAQFERERQRAHRHGVGGIGAGRARGLDQPFGVVGEGGLVEQGGYGGKHGDEMALPGAARNRFRRQFAPPRKGRVNHAWQAPVKHAGAKGLALAPINRAR